MRRFNDLAYRIRALLTPRRLERELAEELDYHLEREVEKLVRAGLAPDAAREQARRRLGSAARQRDQVRWSWGVGWVGDLLGDVRLVGRQIRRNPGFAAGAILTLGLGIGANTAIFSIAEQSLLRSPPVRDPGRLAALYTTCRRGELQCSSSWPDYIDYRDMSATFSGMTAYSPVPLNVGAPQSARLGLGLLVAGDYFSLLGVGAERGRVIQPADDVLGAAETVAVLSHRFWTDAFGADPGVVGQVVRLNDAPFRVIGVAAEGFDGLDLRTRADVWLPIKSGPALGASAGGASDPEVFDQRGTRWIGTLVGRLEPDASIAQAQDEMERIAFALGEQYPDERAAVGGVRGITVDPLRGYILPLGNEDTLRRFIFLLAGVVAITLLLAAANLANLLLARATARGPEIGIRLAVGAGRGRVMRQLLTESLVLALIGGLLGLAVARSMLRALGAFELPGGVSIADLAVGLNPRVLGFALGLSFLTAVLFGLIPALHTVRGDLAGTVKGGSPGGHGHAPLRKLLVSVQVGLCLVLLVGSGLFLRTLRNSLDASLGFEPDRVAVARFNLALIGYSEERGQTFVHDLLADVRALPGVESASLSTLVPFQGGGFRGTFVTVDGYTPRPDEEMRVDWVLVESDFLRTLGASLLEGRELRDTDRVDAPAVAVINRRMAELYWPGRSPVGSMFSMGETPIEVVGVVDNPVWAAIGEEPTSFIFLSQDQLPSASNSFLTLVVRTTGDPDAYLPQIRDRFRAAEPGLSLTTLRAMNDQLGTALMPQRMGSTLLVMLGALALILAAVGIFGVVSYTVRRQRRDIGIRIAMGAPGGTILWGVLSDMAMPVGLGLAAGVAAALSLGQTVETFMFGISAADPATFIGIGALLIVVAVVASLVPARAAARLDPVEVLRSD
jgi:predicted permease